MFKGPIRAAKQLETATANSRGPKYDRPKILLIDVGEDARKRLENEGYNVAAGTFGRPYQVQKGAGYAPVIVKPVLPNFTEKEIIAIDLVPPDPTPNQPAEKSMPMEEPDWWAKCSNGFIDPRPRAMAMVREYFDRILESGGVFVIFSESPLKQELVIAEQKPGYSAISIQGKLSYNNWSFLSFLSNLSVTYDHGEEIRPLNDDWPLVRLLADYLEDATFGCTFAVRWDIHEQWAVLAENKYGAAVAGVLTASKGSKGGWIFVLPSIRDKGGFLADLLKDILPNVAPALFSHTEGEQWVHRAEYELPFVVQKQQETSAIRDEAEKKIADLETAIQKERDSNQFLYDLLRSIGESNAVFHP